jgi:5-methylcytosine-specific restriction endonuclease McrA
MKSYVKLYLDLMGYDISDWIPCEVCEAQAVDINHIDSRKIGGTKKPERIENLMAMCRKCHTELADIKELKPKLKHIHKLRMKERGL